MKTDKKDYKQAGFRSIKSHILLNELNTKKYPYVKKIKKNNFRNARIVEEEAPLWKRFFLKTIQGEFFSSQKTFVLDEENKSKIAFCFDWIINGIDGSLNKGLLFTGGVGTGKSCLMKAVRVFCEILHADVYSRYVTADAISRLYYYRDEACERMLTQIMTCKLLFIDDVGYEALKVFDHYPIPEVLRERYDKKRITCVTTNLSMEEIALRYGKSFEDKLNEMTFILKFNGKSKR